jgi:hypothetical protein
VAEKADGCSWAGVAAGPRTSERATRELARRQIGTVEVRLLWHPEGDWVEISLRDLALGTGVRVPVAPGSALDAFYHPYAYAPASDPPGEDRDNAMTGDG